MGNMFDVIQIIVENGKVLVDGPILVDIIIERIKNKVENPGEVTDTHINDIIQNEINHLEKTKDNFIKDNKYILEYSLPREVYENVINEEINDNRKLSSVINEIVNWKKTNPNIPLYKNAAWEKIEENLKVVLEIGYAHWVKRNNFKLVMIRDRRHNMFLTAKNFIVILAGIIVLFILACSISMDQSLYL